MHSLTHSPRSGRGPWCRWAWSWPAGVWSTSRLCSGPPPAPTATWTGGRGWLGNGLRPLVGRPPGCPWAKIENWPKINTVHDFTPPGLWTNALGKTCFYKSFTSYFSPFLFQFYWIVICLNTNWIHQSERINLPSLMLLTNAITPVISLMCLRFQNKSF